MIRVMGVKGQGPVSRRVTVPRQQAPGMQEAAEGFQRVDLEFQRVGQLGQRAAAVEGVAQPGRVGVEPTWPRVERGRAQHAGRGRVGAVGRRLPARPRVQARAAQRTGDAGVLRVALDEDVEPVDRRVGGVVVTSAVRLEAVGQQLPAGVGGRRVALVPAVLRELGGHCQRTARRQQLGQLLQALGRRPQVIEHVQREHHVIRRARHPRADQPGHAGPHGAPLQEQALHRIDLDHVGRDAVQREQQRDVAGAGAVVQRVARCEAQQLPRDAGIGRLLRAEQVRPDVVHDVAQADVGIGDRLVPWAQHLGAELRQRIDLVAQRGRQLRDELDQRIRALLRHLIGPGRARHPGQVVVAQRAVHQAAEVLGEVDGLGRPARLPAVGKAFAQRGQRHRREAARRDDLPQFVEHRAAFVQRAGMRPPSRRCTAAP
jgi:hypothetical protein